MFLLTFLHLSDLSYLQMTKITILASKEITTASEKNAGGLLLCCYLLHTMLHVNLHTM